MNVKKLVSNGQTYYANAIYSDDDNGWYCEIWQVDHPGTLQTGTHDTEREAWAEAKDIVLLEASVK